MKRLLRAILITAILGVVVYWAGADVYGLWLPVKLPWKTYHGEYAAPSVTIANATHEQVAEQLLSGWLECYKSGDTEPLARIREYEIVSLQDFEDTPEGFVFQATFNLKPYGRPPAEISLGTTIAELKTVWISGNGIIEDGWVKDKVFFIRVARNGDTYSVANLGTGY